MKAVAYYRVSTDRQGKSGLGLEAQQNTAQTWVLTNGMEIVHEFQEVESGRCKERPVLAEALRHCRLFGTTLIVAKVDRLARNSQFLMSIYDSGVPVVFCDLPVVSGPMGRYVLQNMSAIAELESGMIRDRIKAAFAARRAQGKIFKGRPGAVITEDMRRRSVLARKERALSRARDYRDVGLVTDGGPLNAAARGLNERRVPTPSGSGSWTPTTVRRLRHLVALA